MESSHRRALAMGSGLCVWRVMLHQVSRLKSAFEGQLLRVPGASSSLPTLEGRRSSGASCPLPTRCVSSPHGQNLLRERKETAAWCGTRDPNSYAPDLLTALAGSITETCHLQNLAKLVRSYSGFSLSFRLHRSAPAAARTLIPGAAHACLSLTPALESLPEFTVEAKGSISEWSG